MTGPSVYVGPEPEPDIEAAVRRGGGTLTDAATAEAIVWLGGPDGPRDRLTPRVRWVQLGSAGIDHYIDAGVIDDRRSWTSAAGAYAESVAEHALALILAGRRRLAECARSRSWRADLQGRPAAGSTVVIVGAGGIGTELVRLLGPLDMKIVTVTRSGRALRGTESIAADRLNDVLPRADVVVLAAPATPETRHLIGAEELGLLPKHALVVNVARGSLVDHHALLAALEAGALGGAALDVTDPEPLPDDHPLWRLPSVLITPHVANPPGALLPALARRVEANVARFASGQELIGLIDAGRGY